MARTHRVGPNLTLPACQSCPFRAAFSDLRELNMPATDAEQPWTTAVEQLEALGLSAYAAQTLVTLFSIGEGTARNVSEVSNVPRTRVYDAIEELRQYGLVDVQQSTPQRFWAVSPETAGRIFQTEYTQRVNTLLDAIDDLETTSVSEEQRGVWTVTGRDTATQRVIDFIDTAEEEIIYTTVEALLTDEILDSLQDAGERGVSVTIGGMSAEVENKLADAIPEVKTIDTIWEWSDSSAGRLLLVDRQRTLVSVLITNGSETIRDETAIWGTGETNSLVVVLRAMFGWQLDSGGEA
mgnify:CR=1 FL=1